MSTSRSHDGSTRGRKQSGDGNQIPSPPVKQVLPWERMRKTHETGPATFEFWGRPGTSSSTLQAVQSPTKISSPLHGQGLETPSSDKVTIVSPPVADQMVDLPGEQESDDFPMAMELDDFSVPPPAEVTLPRYESNMSVQDYADRCLPALLQAMNLPAASVQQSSSMARKLAELVQLALSPTSGATSEPAGHGTKGDPIDVESHVPDTAKAEREAVEDSQEAMEMAKSAASSPTAAAISQIQRLVGGCTDSIKLKVYPEQYQFTTISEDSFIAPETAVYMRHVRRLASGRQLCDSILHAISRMKAPFRNVFTDTLGWTVYDNRVLFPMSSSEYFRHQPLNKDGSSDAEQYLMFLFDPTVTLLIWILGYRNHWVTCTATPDGRVLIYDSAGYKPDVAERRALHQITAMTSSPHIQEQWQNHQWTVQFGPCPTQRNGSDCGIFALECALELFHHGRITTTGATRDCEAIRMSYIQLVQDGVQAAIDQDLFAPNLASVGQDNGAFDDSSDEYQGSSDGDDNDCDFMDVDDVGDDSNSNEFDSVGDCDVKSTVRPIDWMAKLPIATELDVEQAKRQKTLWTTKYGPSRSQTTCIWNQPRRTINQVVISYLLTCPNGRAPYSKIREVLENTIDTRRRLSETKGSGFKSVFLSGIKWTELTGKYHRSSAEPIPLMIVSAKGEQQPLQRTLVIVQIRASSNPDHEKAMHLLERGRQLLEAFNDRVPIPTGVTSHPYTAADLDNFYPREHGHIIHHMWGISSNDFLLVEQHKALHSRVMDHFHQLGIPLHVIVVGTGADGLSTNNQSWKKLSERWPGFSIDVCLLIPRPSAVLDYLPALASCADSSLATIYASIQSLCTAFEAIPKRQVDDGPDMFLADRSAARDLSLAEALVRLFQLVYDYKEESKAWIRGGYVELAGDRPAAGLYQELGLHLQRNSFRLGAQKKAPRARRTKQPPPLPRPLTKKQHQNELARIRKARKNENNPLFKQRGPRV